MPAHPEPVDAAGSARLNRLLLAGLCLVLPIGVYLMVTRLAFASGDVQEFVLPWLDYIVVHGRFAALADSFSNYTPPYLYLLSVASLLDGLVPRVLLIKFISLGFGLLGAWAAYDIARLVGRPRSTALLAALVLPNLPTVLLNSVVWGQCDIIFVVFLLGFADAVLRGRPALAMAAFAAALSVKLQSIFIAPFLLYLLLAGFFRLRHIVIVPAVYLAFMLPAALAGRGWTNLLAIYLYQTMQYPGLSLGAPNPYLLLQAVLPPGNAVVKWAGMAVAVLASLGLVAGFDPRSRASDPGRTLAMMVLTLVLVPYLLPHMHERYFFAADVLGFALVLARPSAWPIAVLLQIASSLACVDYLYGLQAGPYVAILPMTAVIGLLIRELRRPIPPAPIAAA